MAEGQILFLLLALLFGLAAGLVGCFALMKRMLLAGDVISHLALPGLGAAFLFKVNPLIGGATTLFLGTLLVWQLQKKTGLTTDATIGVVFAAALAIGAAVTPRQDLIDALFGELQQVSPRGFLLGLAATLVVALSLFLLKDRLALAIFSPDLAATTGVNVDRVNLSFLLVFSLTVLIGLRFMGTLLASALIILPAAAARQLTEKLSNFLVVSAAISLVSVLAGFLLNAFVLKLSILGPTIVLFSAFFFALSMLAKKA
ncbi:MAG TPA: metal ABC transporter permease [Candidatus Baltobacteraceae bacterium]|nr:metal ABC transporter permease [Candidatus Baltobacteraceae bacterium]